MKLGLQILKLDESHPLSYADEDHHNPHSLRFLPSAHAFMTWIPADKFNIRIQDFKVSISQREVRKLLSFELFISSAMLKSPRKGLDTLHLFRHTWRCDQSNPLLALQPCDGTAEDLSYKEKIV